MMNVQTKVGSLAVLLLLVVLFQAPPVLARSDDLIKQEIEAQVTESAALRSTRIAVYVEEQLVVLTGQVRLYEQKLVSERIAWTTPDVFDVHNEIRVLPKRALSDAAIERKIRELVKADERFRPAGLSIRVEGGKVFLKGSFLNLRYPSMLKHKVAEIEGVIDIEISTKFLARDIAGIQQQL